MKPVEITHEGVPSKDDPQVETAMQVWDTWTADEQREFFRTYWRHVIAWQKTEDIDRLVRFAESVDGTVRLESTTDLRQKIRESRDIKPVPADPADVEALIRQLEG